MKLLTYIHDPDDLYIPLIKNTKFPKLIDKNTVIAISKTTTKNVKNLIPKLGFTQIEGGKYGTARINLLKYANSNKLKGPFLLCDFDKLIHWINTNKEEFIETFKYEPKADLTVIARSARALSTYPETWTSTEEIATRVLAKIIRKKVDFMNGPLILNEKASKIIAKNAKNTGVGSCAEFCLITNNANLLIDNLEVDGLTWEDPDRYTTMIKASKNYEDWKYNTYHSLYEWRKRILFLENQIKSMIELSNEPINPKYPIVHNKTIETT